MKLSLRVGFLAVSAALFPLVAQAEKLTDADREALVETLEKLRDTSDTKEDSRFRIALAAYRAAMASDDAARDFYLSCTEKAEFKDKFKSPGEFRDWRRQQAEALSDPRLRLAVRHQLRWLVLTLEAASPKSDRSRLASDAQAAMDSLVEDYEKLASQQQILGQAVTGSVFAQAFAIKDVKVEKWPLSPLDLAGVYDQILLPPFRKATTLGALRAGWMKRIQQETALKAVLTKTPVEPREGKEKRDGAPTSSKQSSEYLQFVSETLPGLQWAMEVDLFSCGDESGASLRMLAHLQKHQNHSSYRDWTSAFTQLITPEPLTLSIKPTSPGKEGTDVVEERVIEKTGVRGAAEVGAPSEFTD